MPSINFNDLAMALEFASVGMFEARAVVSRENGNIYLDSTDLDETLPEDIDDPDKYAQVPSKYDLDLGQRLVMKFVASELPESYEDIRGIFRRKGAYGRYKDLLEKKGKLQAWYDFEAQAVKSALCDWAEAEGFTVEFASSSAP